MGFRSLVSLGLLAIPIGVTLGLLLGIDTYRQATGQTPLFVDNKVSKDRYCQKAFGISPESQGQQYTLNPNQWGWNEGEAGGLCMNVTSFNNGTYATNTTAPQFSVTWQYPMGPETQPVHAFPNIKLDGEGNVFPAEISKLKSLNVDVEWHYGVGTDLPTSTDVSELTTDLVNTNVAIDMFLDSDSSKAQSSTQAKYEVMVWLATFGSATQPIGLKTGAVTSMTIGATVFNLYYGQNGLGQYVLTWSAAQTTEQFSGDLSPLITSLPGLNHANFPTANDYLGYMGLGSECLWSNYNVTFSVPKLSIDVQTQ